jgi:hypothetical protein
MLLASSHSCVVVAAAKSRIAGAKVDAREQDPARTIDRAQQMKRRSAGNVMKLGELNANVKRRAVAHRRPRPYQVVMRSGPRSAQM